MLELEGLQWSKASTDPILAPGDLHIWKIPCGWQGADLARLWPLLSRTERHRAERLRQDLHRQRYIRAHAGLRRILSIYTKNDPHLIELKHERAGKPYIDGKLEFNLTTSADLALAAICIGKPVGIDCERLRPRSSQIAIARRMFTAEEAERVAATPERLRSGVFSQAWTALEASVKMDGRGLFRNGDEPPLPSLDVAHFVPATGYIAAVARSGLPPISEWTTLQLG